MRLPKKTVREFEKIRHPKKRAFLEAFSHLGSIKYACGLADINKTTHWRWMQNDPAFAAAFEEARETAAERLEYEAHRRAVEGVAQPVFYKGKMVMEGRGKEKKPVCLTKYSDRLLMFLLAGAMPEKYKQRVYTEHTGNNGGPIGVNKYDSLTDEELDALLDEKIAALAKFEANEKGGGGAGQAGRPGAED